MMKKLNLLSIVSLFFFASTNVSGQFSKGSTWLGGSGSYSSSTFESQFNSKTTNEAYAINPAIGKVVNQGTVIGIELTYSHQKQEQNSFPQGNKNSFYGAGIFGRKYAETIKKLYLFAHAGINGGYGVGNQFNSTPSNYETKGWQAAIFLYPGVSYALTSKILLEAAFINLFGISYSDYKGSNSTYRNKNFTAGINLNNAGGFGLGIRFVLPGSADKKTN